MKVINIYKCLCDIQRLRILNLLRAGPLCVCHLMEILQADQVKISKQLRYMKDLGIVQAERRAQWMVYSLSEDTNPLLSENLKCLQDCFHEQVCFAEDLEAHARISSSLQGSPCLPIFETKVPDQYVHSQPSHLL
ncbi:MAG: ArsR/SmtB family transcription factor [Puniceicoccaceae bacterium]